MNCPLDQGDLTSHEEAGIRFHYCAGCHGMFFAKEHLLGCLRRGITAGFSGSPEVIADVTVKVIRRECPECHATTMMDKLLDDVAIDICPACKGVWLDAGELNKIVERHQRKSRSSKPEEGNRAADDLFDAAGNLVMDEPGTMEEIGAAVGDFFGGAAEWLGDAGSSVGEFFTIDF
jgi:Zn-finger nucleic acid-binding protein